MATGMNLPPLDLGPPSHAGNPASGSLPVSGRAQFGQASASALGMKWSALHDAAGVVCTLAGLAAEPLTATQRNFPAVMRDAGGWRKIMAEQGIADISAFMEPGLSALLAVHARGVNPAAPALTLWQEFVGARDALMALIPPAGDAGPVRRA